MKNHPSHPRTHTNHISKHWYDNKNIHRRLMFCSIGALLGVVVGIKSLFVSDDTTSAGSISANRDQMAFLNSGFWNDAPSNADIIKALFGSSGNTMTAYTQYWSGASHNCFSSGLTVQTVAPGNYSGWALTGNTIYVLQSGLYLFSGRITVTGDCVALIADTSNAGSSLMSGNRIDFSLRKYLILDGFIYDPSANNGFGGVTINFNDTTDTMTHGVSIFDYLNSNAQNNLTRIFGSNARRNSIVGSTLVGAGYGLYLDGNSRGSRIYNNIFSGNRSTGIDVCPSHDNDISGNIFRGIGFSGNQFAQFIGGVWLECGSTNNLITNNIFDGNRYGIQIDGSNTNMISGNEMMNNQLAAIMAFGTTNNSSIINNYIHNNGTRGIEMRSSNNTMISGNTLRDNLVANILINATAVNATVRNNLIESTAVFTGNAHGVYTYGSGTKILNNTILHMSGMGMGVFNTANNTLFENNIVSGAVHGFRNETTGANGVTISGLDLYGSRQYAMLLSVPMNLINIKTHNNAGPGILLMYSGTRSRLTNVQSYENLSGGIVFDRSGSGANTAITGYLDQVRIYNNGGFGILCNACRNYSINNTLIFNNVQDSQFSGHGIRVADDSYAAVFQTTGAGIVSGLSINNTQIFQHDGYGIYIPTSSGLIVVNNTQIANNAGGILASASTLLNTIGLYNNTQNGSGGIVYGILGTIGSSYTPDGIGGGTDPVIAGLGWTTGNIQTISGSMSCEYLSLPLRPWYTGLLPYGRYPGNTACDIVGSINSPRSEYPLTGFIGGDQLLFQSPSVKISNLGIQLDASLSYNANHHIGLYADGNDLLDLMQQSGTPLSTLIQSNQETIQGVQGTTTASISGGEMSINNNAYTTIATPVNNGDTIRLRLMSPASYETTGYVTVTIGQALSSFFVMTKQDDTPDVFSLTNISNAEVSSGYISSTTILTGFVTGGVISLTNGAQRRVNGGSFTGATGYVYPGDVLQILMSSSNAYSTLTTTTITIGDMTTNRSITTKAAPVSTATPPSGGGGGGGGLTLSKDNCPGGDYTSSFYDNSCGTSTHNSATGQQVQIPQNLTQQIQERLTELAYLDPTSTGKMQCIKPLVQLQGFQARFATQLQKLFSRLDSTKALEYRTTMIVRVMSSTSLSEAIKDELTYIVARVYAQSTFYTQVQQLSDEQIVSWMYSNNLTSKESIDTFMGNAVLKREEAAKFYTQFLKELMCKVNYIKTEQQCTFVDLPQATVGLRPWIVESCRLGLFRGVSETQFDPQSTLTKEQAVTVLMKIIFGEQSGSATDPNRATPYIDLAVQSRLIKNAQDLNRDEYIIRKLIARWMYRIAKTS